MPIVKHPVQFNGEKSIMPKKIPLISFASSIMISLILSGCTGPSLYQPLPQSHFVYPNGEPNRLDHVKGTVTKTYIMPFQIPEFQSARLQREAYAIALEKSGGDLIIDGDYSVRSTLIPLPFLQIVTVEGTVEGTAAGQPKIGPR
jgi:hypothetical protein